MAMNGTARGDNAYNAVAAANPNFSKLSSAEQSTLKSYFETLFGADTTYIKGNADVIPAALSGEALSAPAGQLVNVTSGPGAGSTGETAADTTLNGKGSIV